MLFPDRDEDLQARVMWLIQRCKETQRDRVNMYDRRERYFLFGAANADPVRYNRIMSHLDLVSSFLYSPDHAFFNIAAARNASDLQVNQAKALQDEFNDDLQDGGIYDTFGDALPWSLTYNTMIAKQGWNDVAGHSTMTLIAPHSFGVFREDLPGLDQQEAFVHTFPLEYYDAVQRLVRAGRKSEIGRIATTQEARPTGPFPDMLHRLIIAGTGGLNLSGNVFGAVNPDYVPTDTYQPQTAHPMVMFDELWAWDTLCADYRIFHVIEPDIIVGDSKRTVKAMLSAPKMRKLLEDKARTVPRRRRRVDDGQLMAVLDTTAPGDDEFKVSECNLFFPGDNPFTKIQAFRKWNYFWGIAHIDALMSLQDWLNERFEQIDDILDRQAYPPRVGTGMGGVSDEKFEAFGAADTWILEQMPNARVEELHPQMPPDLFAEVKEIGAFFLEASGLTDITAGQSAEGVRSGTHAKQLKNTGSGRIKKAALALEPALIRIGDLALKLKMRNDDHEITPEDGHAFLPSQISTAVKMRISAHSHSPLFADDAREMAVLLKKAESIDNDMFVRMMHPPQIDAILHGQRKAAAEKREQIASLPPEDRAALIAGKKPGASHGRAR